MPINLIDKIKPANSGSFPMVDAGDVAFTDGERLDTKMADRPVIEVVDKLPDSPDPDTIYIVEDGGVPGSAVTLQNKTVSSFSSYTASGDEETAIYAAGFIYRGQLTESDGVPLGNYLPSVTYSYSDAAGGNLCTECIYDSAGTLYLYSKAATGVTVPVIRFEVIS